MDDYRIHSGDSVVRSDTLPADLAHQLSSASARKIPLKSGGNIVIDPCEALTVIDVNSASYTGSSTKEASVTAANLDPASEYHRNHPDRLHRYGERNRPKSDIGTAAESVFP